MLSKLPPSIPFIYAHADWVPCCWCFIWLIHSLGRNVSLYLLFFCNIQRERPKLAYFVLKMSSGMRTDSIASEVEHGFIHLACLMWPQDVLKCVRESKESSAKFKTTFPVTFFKFLRHPMWLTWHLGRAMPPFNKKASKKVVLFMLLQSTCGLENEWGWICIGQLVTSQGLCWMNNSIQEEIMQ